VYRIRIRRQRYGFGSFHPQTKILRKTLISTVLKLLNGSKWLFIFEEYVGVNVPSKSTGNKPTNLKKYLFGGDLKVTDERSRIRRRI
jgi:hypothetical protein